MSEPIHTARAKIIPLDEDGQPIPPERQRWQSDTAPRIAVVPKRTWVQDGWLHGEFEVPDEVVGKFMVSERYVSFAAPAREPFPDCCYPRDADG